MKFRALRHPPILLSIYNIRSRFTILSLVEIWSGCNQRIWETNWELNICCYAETTLTSAAQIIVAPARQDFAPSPPKSWQLLIVSISLVARKMLPYEMGSFHTNQPEKKASHTSATMNEVAYIIASAKWRALSPMP